MPIPQTTVSAISEATLVARWLSGPRGVRQTEDGRSVRVLFPGVPGGGSGPDVRDAVIELAGDELRGDIEVHLKSRGWYQHGHQNDPAYGRVILHLVAENDAGTLVSSHVSGRAIPIAVTAQHPFPGYAPPCTLHPDPRPTLAALGLRRVQSKAATIAARLRFDGPAQPLYELIVNAVLPVGLAAGHWSPAQAEGELATLGAPGTYGRLKRLEGWLSTAGEPPFKKAGALQGGLLLHAQYCSRGRCGACPLSSA